MNDQKVIAVFGSSDPRAGDAAYVVAARLGRLIAEHGWVLLNGGYGGIMAASAAAAKAAGGHTIGVTLSRWQRPNEWIDEEVRTTTLYERLDAMITRADAFLVLPGGTGTLAEVGVVWELMNKRFTAPRPLIFVGDFWRPLVELMLPAPDVAAHLGGLVDVAKDADEAVGMVGDGLRRAGPNTGGTGFQPVTLPRAAGLPSPIGGTGFQPVTSFRETRRNLPHMQEPGRTYFVTFRVKRGDLSAQARQLVLDACRFWHARKYQLHACTVMPDHVHLLLTPLPLPNADGVHSLSQILHSIKSYSSNQINRLMGRQGTLWQDESLDRIVRDQQELLEKWDYIRNNAVKRRLVGDPESYPFLYDGTLE